MATPRRALPAILLVAACATAPDDAARTVPLQQQVVEPPAPSRQPVAFEAVVLVTGTTESPTVLLRSVSPVMEFDPSDRFWMERDHAESFTVTLRDQEDGTFAFDACDLPARRVRLEDGERVTLSLIGRIPGFDDDRRPKTGVSDVVPRSR